MPGSLGFLRSNLGSLWTSTGVGWLRASLRGLPGGDGRGSGKGRLGGVSQGCRLPQSLTEMLHCHLVTTGPRRGKVGGPGPGRAPPEAAGPARSPRGAQPPGAWGWS